MNVLRQVTSTMKVLESVTKRMNVQELNTSNSEHLIQICKYRNT